MTNSPENLQQRRLAFWDSRARLGQTAGTNDFLLTRIERQAILERVPPDARVLDVGCGNGETLISLARERGCTGVGVDYASEMIDLAKAGATATGCVDRVAYHVGMVPGLPRDLGTFEVALTQRCLINLDSQAEQHDAFVEIVSFVKPGGCYLMVESFIQGLDRTNKLREMLGLERIEVPWHNLFLDEAAVEAWATAGIRLEEAIPISSTYHFLSRVVYAKLAQDRGEELRYDSDINLLACKLPIIGDFGPVRLYIWRRAQGQ